MQTNPKIYGDYHTHTDNSDGKNTVEEMISAASKLGLREIAITDHGHGRFIFSKIKPKNYAMVRALIQKSAEENNIKVLFGVEANITGPRGQIDVQTEHSRELDILLCGIHLSVKPAGIASFFTYTLPNWFWWMIRWTPRGRIAKNTEAVRQAILNNNIDILTHPNKYFRVNVVEIAKACVERGTLIELNGKKISFRPIDFERMAALGAKFIINSDAHKTTRIADVDKIFEFLKLCDYREEDIINLNAPFKKPEPIEIPDIKTKE